MASAPKSNACAKALWAATKDVNSARTVEVPIHLRDSHYKGAKDLGHGENYNYPHDSADGYVPQEYLGVNSIYYEPKDQGFESQIRKRLDSLKKQAAQAEATSTRSQIDHE